MYSKMKKIINILAATALLVLAASCSKNDDFTESIFDTSVQTIDQNASTAPFDQWLYDNFVVPYNTEIQYKFNYPASNLSFQLSPADYDKSQLLANFIKYLFYDVYTLYGGQDFMKLYGPRIFHFIGSSAYAPTTGTETLGYASAGVKITLIGVNNLKMWKSDNQYTPGDIDELNRQQFHTMHHEFSHIMHQTKSYPVTFGQVTAGTYEPRNWQDRDSVMTHSLGYLTHYGSSATYEDFVETLSCTITDTDYRWMTTIIDACLNVGGLRAGEKDRILTLIDSLGIEGLDDPAKAWNNFYVSQEEVLNSETNKYEPSGWLMTSFHETDRREKQAVDDKTVRFKKVADFTSFRSFLNAMETENAATVTSVQGNFGINAILKKIEIATKWYTDNWGLYLFKMRSEVRNRQNNINNYVRDNVTIYELK